MPRLDPPGRRHGKRRRRFGGRRPARAACGGGALEPVADTPHGKRAVALDSEDNRVALHPA